MTTDFGGSDGARAVAVQADGKLVAAGVTTTLSSRQDYFALARYNANGSLDQTFETGGRVTTDFPGGYDKINALAVQGDGKLVAVGATDDGENSFGVARYNPDGSLDQSFGTGGKVTGAGANALAVQGTKLVAAGGGGDFVLARYRTR